MNHFLPIPIFMLAIIILFVSDKFNLKLFKTIAKFTITISVLVFIYEYAQYLGYDLIEIIYEKFLKI